MTQSQGTKHETSLSSGKLVQQTDQIGFDFTPDGVKNGASCFIFKPITERK